MAIARLAIPYIWREREDAERREREEREEREKERERLQSIYK